MSQKRKPFIDNIIHHNKKDGRFLLLIQKVDTLGPRSHGTGSVWSRHLVRSVYGHIYSYHFFYDTL